MREISKQFDFKEREGAIYKLWEESGFFNPDNIESAKRYCNILPPPNANGELHIGHASGYTVMDIFGRFERMNGKKVLLLPGKDHAGIQTQVVFERKLKEERGITRQMLGREKFYQECYDFCINRSDYMRSQEKRIGISADWSREKFTLDPDGLKTALETFVKMYKDGLVYKGHRIINWCSRCGTALSDVEVEHKEREGKLYHIKYPVKDSKEFVVVATTRPETMLGDTAVAVNPKDKRYLGFIGQTLVLPLQNREIPVIADRRIDMEFGTGAVKITPAHDMLDWQIGKDHKLPEIQVIDEKAEITLEGGSYAGLGVSEARAKIITDLAGQGLLEKEEALVNNVSVCERCKTVIEPLVSKQWFVKVDGEKYSLKKKTLELIKSGKVEVYPENFKKILIQWLGNLQDWCISRQIWWGPRFPVWYRGEETYVGLEAPKGDDWIQDENTFDTWFSSGQWPYTTLGYPNGKDYKNFYPTDTMITGRDLLFFWAARMLMLGQYRTGKTPFRNLYFTGLVRDKEGHKFSKSRGNGIDPLEIIEKFGADALRLSLVMDISPGQDSRLFEEKIESFRNFVTKLWNIFRYCEQSDVEFALVEKISKRDLKTLADKWIVSQLEDVVKKVSEHMKDKNISLAQDALRKFTWDSFADWYLEINKMEKNSKVLGYVLDRILKLWHPFTPFVTEEIYGILNSGSNVLMMAKWPKSEKKFIDAKAQTDFSDLQDLVAKIRNMRANYHIDPTELLEGYAKAEIEKEIIGKLARVRIGTGGVKKKMIQVSTRLRTLRLDIAKSIDVAKETASIRKEIANLENLIAKNEGMLKNKKFTAGAPTEVILSAKNRLEEYKEKARVQKELEKNLSRL
ncbi:MAG: valine--tRNA ligase [Candidatus Moranbacteria bacterium]|nr:valine--tRNA ligase [Candidatus Moranbacteria bacterium]